MISSSPQLEVIAEGRNTEQTGAADAAHIHQSAAPFFPDMWKNKQTGYLKSSTWGTKSLWTWCANFTYFPLRALGSDFKMAHPGHITLVMKVKALTDWSVLLALCGRVFPERNVCSSRDQPFQSTARLFRLLTRMPAGHLLGYIFTGVSNQEKPLRQT